MINSKFMLSHPAHFMALGFGSGLSRFGPGTVATLWAWAVYLIMQLLLQPAEIGIVILIATLVGWWACTVTAEHLMQSDPGSIVWDEIVAFWLILWIWMPVGFGPQLAAFVIFRYFDIAKPGPVKWADQVFKGWGYKGGWGILFDDFVAAFCTLIVLALWRAT
jgi:phosphatidylglycerophosphatase A